MKMNLDTLTFLKIFGPAIASIIWAIFGWKIYVTEKNIKSNSGNLEHKEEIPNYSENITILAGISDIQFDRGYFDGGKEIDPFQSFNNGDFSLKIKLKDKRILVSSKIRSLDGKITAEIVDNKWEINPNNYFKRNYDKSGFEVIDPFGIPVFQIDLINKNVLRLGGIFVCDSGFVILKSNSSPLTFHGGKPDFEKLKKEGEEIKKLFKYPASKHHGKRDRATKDLKTQLIFKPDTFFTTKAPSIDANNLWVLLLNGNLINQSNYELSIRSFDLHFKKNIFQKKQPLISPSREDLMNIKQIQVNGNLLDLNRGYSFQNFRLTLKPNESKNGYMIMYSKNKIDYSDFEKNRFYFTVLDSDLIIQNVKIQSTLMNEPNKV